MAIFIVSFCLKPLRNPIMTLWLRIIESDRPVFKLLFGGTAALAKAIQKISRLCGDRLGVGVGETSTAVFLKVHQPSG
jgi:hypothetical protein